MRPVYWLMAIALVVPLGCAPQTLTPAGTAPVSATPIATTPDDADTVLRMDMVERTIVTRGIEDERVIEAMRTVPRHEFVPEQYHSRAYADYPLPIGYGQTISQPYIVALMTELLELQPGERVLEIGTGSGYQAAILAEFGGLEIFTMEIIPELAEVAAQRLRSLGYEQVRVTQGDGYYGWEEFAPYDAVVVTAAPDHLPQPLVRQLTAGGRLVIPIGPRGGFQTLWKFVNEPDGLKAYNLGYVTFVPLVREDDRPHGGEPSPDNTQAPE